ncbi:MAG: oligosaccharide flippase family protein [Candidatus Aegiribacteria sp.]
MAGRRANSAYMLLGQIVGKAGLFASLMIYSRIFTDGEFGELLFAVAISLILFFLSDMGASLITTRRLVIPLKTDEYLSSALTLRTMLTALSVVVLSVVAWTAGYSDTQTKLLFLVFSGFVLDGYFETFYALFRARDRMVFEGMARSLQGLLAVVLALMIKERGLGHLWAGASYPIRSVLPFILCLAASIRMAGWRYLRPAGVSNAMVLLRNSLPLGLMGFILVAAQRFDNTLVKAVLSDSAVAAWQQCYRMFEPMVLLVAPTLLPGALFADLCRAETAGWPRVRERIKWMTEVFTVMAFLIVIPFFFLGTDILRVVWGGDYLRNLSYMEVRNSLRVLMLGLPVTYVFHIFLAVILAQGRQKRVLLPAAVSFVIQVTGLYLFLESYGIVAAALMQLIFISALTLWLGFKAFRIHGSTGFAAGVARPLLATVPFILSMTLLEESPVIATGVSLAGFLCVWLLTGGGKAVTNPPLSLKG